jgi:tryptophan-rich sensory protein
MSLPLQGASFWALAACIAAAFFEGIMSGTGIKARFAELRLPKDAPGLWAWSIVGVAYYVLFFFLLKSVLARPPVPFWTSVTLTLTALLLLANASWNWIFFRKKDLWLSFVFFVPYPLLAFALGGVLYRIRSPLSGWYALYPAYLVYATSWGYRVWRLNSDPSQSN